MTKKELSEQLMKMPELDSSMDFYEKELKLFTKKELIMRVEQLENSNKRLTSEVQKLEIGDIHKRMNDINTFQCHKRDLYIRGTDELGIDFKIEFDALDFIEWIDTEKIEYIKDQLIKHIKKK
tara:strand:+ start:116 stop:484 length:369 start_codon:yes stop_codon:yes gene_type:complete